MTWNPSKWWADVLEIKSTPIYYRGMIFVIAVADFVVSFIYEWAFILYFLSKNGYGRVVASWKYYKALMGNDYQEYIYHSM